MEEQLPVLVVGAGPAGLTAAAELSRRNVPVRLIDKAIEPSPLSKALMVWPRTLEVLRQLGGAEHIKKFGLPVESFRYYSNARQICRIKFSPATKPSVIIQPHVENLLRDSLTDAGGVVEWRTKLIGLHQDDDSVQVTLRDKEGNETAESFSYVLGCDGGSSSVRHLLELEFHGKTYPNAFILGDTGVQGDLQRDAVHYYQSNRGILVMVPLYNGRFRVFTAGPPDLKPEDVTEKLLQEYVDNRGPGGLVLNDVSWRTAFSIHARHTDRFNFGRVYLAGDAAHIHSPAGGQGLNTGVTDAHNIAWKLAFVHKGSASRALLDTYGTERATVAAAVVKQAEMQTKAWMLKKKWQVVLRDNAARLADQAGVFDRYYSPWLAGLTNRYPENLAVSGPTQRRTGRELGSLHNGQLAPNLQVLVAGEKVFAQLRDVLPTDRYTALVFLPRGDAPSELVAALRKLVSEHRDLVTSRTVTGDGVLTNTLSTHEPPPTVRNASGWRPKALSVALIRPDHYVAAHDDNAGLTNVRAHLANIAGSARPSVAAADGR